MKEGLELLFSLQIEDDQIKDIEETIRQIPKRIKQLEEERDSQKKIIENVKKKRDLNVKQREQLEKEIQLIKEKINKYREQMNKSTTNKEYQGFIAEIKFEEERIAAVEENIIKRMLEFDEIMDEIRDRENDFNTIASEYNTKIKDLNENLKYYQSKLNQENSQKADLRKKIPENLLRIYDNLYNNKAGKAVSLVETEFCGICNIKIRPQLISEIISNENIFICENCGRILFKKIEETEAGS